MTMLALVATVVLARFGDRQGLNLHIPSNSHFKALSPLETSHGCRHVYVDVGSNIGVQVRKLYEPYKYPGSPVLKIFDKYFGSSRRDVCAFGFEPNPHHYARLRKIETVYRARGWRVHFFLAAASIRDGYITMYPNGEEESEEWGASTFVDRHRGAPAVKVKTVDLSAFLMGQVSNVTGNVVMKLDVEGAEFVLNRKLVYSGALCSAVDLLFLEEHEWARASATAGAAPVMDIGLIRKYLSAAKPYCRTTLNPLDDESYLHDGRPLN